MKLSNRILLAAAAAVATATLGAIIVMFSILKQQHLSRLHDLMSGTVIQAETVRRDMDALYAQNAFDAKSLSDRVRREYPGQAFREVYQKTSLYQIIPVVAAWQSVETVADRNHFTFSTPSRPGLPARNSKNDNGAEFQQVFDAFASGKEEFFGLDQRSGHVVFARPVRLTQGCLACHGAPSDSPTANGLDSLGFRMEGMAVGDLKGAFVLTQPMNYDLVYAATGRLCGMGLLILSLVLGAFYLLNRQMIIAPLDRVIEQLTRANGETSAGTSRITSAIQDLAEGASEQASSLVQTSTSLEELTVTTQRNAESARQATSLAHQATDRASGGAALARAAAGEIVSHIEQLEERVQSIQEATRRTTKVVETINQIAFQTNLLALNAAVEAARAGERGSGFAVVAHEVRDLAQRSAREAQSTAQLMEECRTSAEQIGKVVREVDAEIRQVVESRVITAFAGVAEDSRRVSQILTEVSSATTEGATGIDQLNQAVRDIDRVTRATAGSAEQLASSSALLHGQVEDVQGIVRALRRLIHGKGEARES